jgi:hypothetical protein
MNGDNMAHSRPRQVIRHQEMSNKTHRVFGVQPIAGSIRSRATAVVDSDDTIHQQTVNIATGADTLFEVVIRTDSGERFQPIIESALYVGGVLAATRLPGGGIVDESKWQIIGPFRSLSKSDGTETDPGEVCFQLYVRNISNGTVDVLWRYRISYIANRGNAIT